MRERYHEDKYKRVCAIRDQQEIDLESQAGKMDGLKAENEYLQRQLERKDIEVLEQMHRLHELIDAESSIKSVAGNPSLDQAVEAIR